MRDILNSGFSRIPIYRGYDTEDVRGYLLVKTLVVVSINAIIDGKRSCLSEF
jgi:CBS domain containing-hemolysin-like protein